MRQVRRLLLLTVLALLAALAGAGAVRAAPAAIGLDPVAVTFGGPVHAATLPSYGAQGMYVLDYQHAGRAELTLTLRNGGLLPVRVTAVDLPPAVAPLLTMADVQGLPLTLLPGQVGTVTATGVLGNCRYSHERQVELREGLVVALSVLGRSGVREVPLDRPILIHSPMIVGCPDRKLNRQADNRADLFTDR